MTEVYYVRHSKIIYTPEDCSRELSEQGVIDAHKVTQLFDSIHIDRMVSSPYIRAVATIKDVAKSKNIEIELVDELRERKVANTYIADFNRYSQQQWLDFDYKLDGGESFNEVKARGFSKLNEIILSCKDQSIIIGTHGTFLSIYLNHIDQTFGYEQFKKLSMPDVYKVVYEGIEVVRIEHIDIW